MNTVVKELLTTLAEKVIPTITSLFSDQLKDALTEAVRWLYSKSLATDNKFDDAGVKLLADLLSIDVSDVTASTSSNVGTDTTSGTSE